MIKAMEFFKKVTEDSALKSAVKVAIEKAASKDEEVQAVAKIARDAGFDVSADELKAVVVKVLKQSGQLSDKDLENVAGGVTESHYGMGGTVDDDGNLTDVNVTVLEEAGEYIDNTVASVFSGW